MSNPGALDDRVRIAAFRAIYRGEAASPCELARELGVPSEDTEAAIGHLLGRGLVTVDKGGRVNGSHGLSLFATHHRVAFAAGPRYVWCAIDAVGIPAALGVDAEVTSRCFHCGEPVTLTIKGGEPQEPAASSLRIGIGAAGSCGKMIEDVCPVINFFCSVEHAQAWADAAGEGNICEVRHAAELGRSQWADVS